MRFRRPIFRSVILLMALVFLGMHYKLTFVELGKEFGVMDRREDIEVEGGGVLKGGGGASVINRQDRERKGNNERGLKNFGVGGRKRGGGENEKHHEKHEKASNGDTHHNANSKSNSNSNGSYLRGGGGTNEDLEDEVMRDTLLEALRNSRDRGEREEWALKTGVGRIENVRGRGGGVWR